jgi:hypothetical protein
MQHLIGQVSAFQMTACILDRFHAQLLHLDFECKDVESALTESVVVKILVSLDVHSCSQFLQSQSLCDALDHHPLSQISMIYELNVLNFLFLQSSDQQLSMAFEASRSFIDGRRGSSRIFHV